MLFRESMSATLVEPVRLPALPKPNRSKRFDLRQAVSGGEGICLVLITRAAPRMASVIASRLQMLSKLGIDINFQYTGEHVTGMAPVVTSPRDTVQARR